MLFIYGRKVTKHEPEKIRDKTVTKYRFWFTFFFIPIFPYTDGYVIENAKGEKKEVYVPIFITAFILNIMAFFSGIGATFGVLWYFLLVVIMISVLIFNMKNGEFLRNAFLVLIPLSELLCYYKYQQQKERFEEMIRSKEKINVGLS